MYDTSVVTFERMVHFSDRGESKILYCGNWVGTLTRWNGKCETDDKHYTVHALVKLDIVHRSAMLEGMVLLQEFPSLADARKYCLVAFKNKALVAGAVAGRVRDGILHEYEDWEKSDTEVLSS